MAEPLLLFEHSSTSASEVASDLVGKVSLVVTSPPYYNAISYTSHQEDSKKDYRVREEMNYAGEYLDLLNEVWNQCWMMLRPGGHLAINVGSVLSEGKHFPLTLDVQEQLMSSKNNWKFIRNIYWNKVTAGVKRAGLVIQHALPGYWYPNIMSEHIIVVRKSGKQRPLNEDLPEEWWESIWDIAPVPPGIINHPAPFPEEIPHRLIRMLTKPDDYVLDPFNGAGTTTKAALDLKRNAIGFDISPEYNATARARTKEPSSVRSPQIFIKPITPNILGRNKNNRGEQRHGVGQKARNKVTK